MTRPVGSCGSRVITAVFIFIGTIGNFEPDSRSDMSGVGSRDLHIRWQIIVKTLEGLTTRQIAKHLGISKPAISRICQKFKKCVMRITNKQLYKHVI